MVFGGLAIDRHDTFDIAMGIGQEGLHTAVINCLCTGPASMSEELHDQQLRVGHKGIVPESAALQAIRIGQGEESFGCGGIDNGAGGQLMVGVETLVAVEGKKVVGPQRQAKDGRPFHSSAIEGHQAGQGEDLPREMFEKPGSFGYRLFEAMQVKRLQISEAAMDDLQAVEAGVFTKVAFF
jgi:hypothetical protein